MDIPDISVINSSRGFEYGRKMIWFIIELMMDIFGKEGLYRTWDAEFVALCPNTMQQIFYGKCIRMRAALSRIYPKEIRMGYTWSDRVFTGKALVDEAKMIMKRTAPFGSEAAKQMMPSISAPFQSVDGVLASDRFVVLFQPRISLKDGSISGMEALVRGMAEDGQMIPPAHFIEALEEDGTVRNLDLFVLDRAMKTMDEWTKRGIRPFSIAVNFSLATLMDSHIKASVLAIQSRYPDLPEDIIEVDLKESACELSLPTLSEIIEGLRECGVRFVLDGFGSKYSNLSVLANIALDRIKLDRSIISDIAENQNSHDLAANIIGVCAGRGITCVGMGVETKEQEDALIRANCVEAQGFYYDRPLTEEMFFERRISSPPTSNAQSIKWG